MKKLGFLLLSALFLGGCATTTVSTLAANNNMALVHLSKGMSRCKVLDIMGSGIKVYDCDKASSKVPVKVTISNPYHSEMVETSGKTLEVMYYVTSLSSKDCTIGESDLTPLVFEDSKLIGWGSNFLEDVAPGTKPAVKAQQQPEPMQNTQAPAPAAAEQKPAAQ
ncbi:MAG: DUF3192 domain-containing protein [Candidatus Omnitrophica bacterium]|nr:DUF3192 domain-containing protein [Candidatus Omnitrophota bacterium]